MAPRTASKQKHDVGAQQPAPRFWIALVPLPVADELGSGSPRAFNPGDPVPAGHVEQYGWQQFVEAPPGDWTPAQPATTTNESGQAGSDKE